MYRSSVQQREFGVPAGGYTGTRVVDVRKLSEPVRRALAASLSGTGSPTPLLAARAPNVRRLAAVGAAVAGIAISAVSAVDLGALYEPWAREGGLRWAALYALLFVALVLGTVVWGARARREGRRPLPQGTFLLPLDLLVIEGWRMTVVPFGDARHVDIDPAGRAVTLTYADGRLVRVQGARATKTSLLADLLSAQHTLEDATLAGKPDRDDRLGEVRAGGWEGVLAAEGEAPAALPNRRRLALVAAVAAAAGLLAWQGRERVSDELMFRDARRYDRPAQYDAYLALGTAHAREVDTDLLPSAMLRDARSWGENKGSTREYDRFLRRYPDGPRAAQARVELDALCTRQFREETAGHDTQIAWFEGHYTECRISKELEDEVRAKHASAELDRLLSSPRIDALFGFAERCRDPATTERAQREIEARIKKLEDAERTRLGDDGIRSELLALVALAHARHAPATVLVRSHVDGVSDIGGVDFAASLRRNLGAPSDLGLVVFQSWGTGDVTWSFDLRQEDSLMYTFQATRLGGGLPIALRGVVLKGRLLATPGSERWLGDHVVREVVGFTPDPRVTAAPFRRPPPTTPR